MELIHAVLAKWWIVACLGLLGMGSAAFVTAEYITPMYEAKTTLFIGKEANSLAGISISDITLGDKLVGDYRELIKTRLIAEDVVRILELDMPYETLVGRLKISTISDSRFINVNFQDSDPAQAARITDTLSEVLVYRAEEIVGAENVRIVDYAVVPKSPVSPNLRMNVMIAGVLGAMAGLFLIFLLMMMDNTIKREGDIEKHLGISVLGVVPKFKGMERVKQ
ncbi:YveK family protein [Anaerotalea alkaliphila]|nr:GNVR domain-containing protein [Anaerotalea alkaliphila]